VRERSDSVRGAQAVQDARPRSRAIDEGDRSHFSSMFGRERKKELRLVFVTLKAPSPWLVELCTWIRRVATSDPSNSQHFQCPAQLRFWESLARHAIEQCSTTTALTGLQHRVSESAGSRFFQRLPLFQGLTACRKLRWVSFRVFCSTNHQERYHPSFQPPPEPGSKFHVRAS
jgi:hypothetical protein